MIPEQLRGDSAKSASELRILTGRVEQVLMPSDSSTNSQRARIHNRR